MNELNTLPATALASALDGGQCSAADVTRACVERIAAVEGEVQAWQCFSAEYALAQAAELDLARQEGRTLGPLHGIPVGIKDIIDTADLPTEDGTVLHAGRQPKRDATLVSRLRAAGAVIMGKTVTAELATYTPGKTRNPHDASRTPGGSSSGSAAAVAAGMVPLAIGTQTNGSVIRPAAYCGVVGFKPTFGLIPRTGCLSLSTALDHVGVFGRSVEDVALLAEVLAGSDGIDTASPPLPVPQLRRIAATEPPMPPTLAFIKTSAWKDADAETQEAFAELAGFLGERVAEIELPEMFDRTWDLLKMIMEADIARALSLEYERGRDKLSDSLVSQIERGQRVTAVDYNNALAQARVLQDELDGLFDSFDAILTPAATGVAPPIATTGSAVFCSLWTLTGMPALALPLMTGSGGMPLGVQLVGRRNDDARLLRSARWLVGQAAAQG